MNDKKIEFQRPGGHCGRMRHRLRFPDPKPETDEEWRARARRDYARRNDPRPPPDPRMDLSIFFLNYDVLDEPEKRAFDAYWNSRDDRILWSFTYSMGTGDKPDGPISARYAAADRVVHIHTASWTDMRVLMERISSC